MANALAFEMPRDENPLSPIPTVGSPAPAAGPSKSKKNGLAFTQPVAPPQPRKMAGPAKPQGNALTSMASAFMPQQQKPDAMYAFVDTLQRTVDPAGAQARESKMTADQQTKLQQGLAFVQQMKAIPADKRMAFAQQGVGQFGLGQTQFDPNGFTDEALAMSEATLSAQLGQAPEAPEYMNLGGGNVGKVQGGTFSMAREPTPEPVKPIEVNGRLVDPNTYEVLGDYSDQDSEQGVKWDTEMDASGNMFQINPYTGEKRPLGIKGRVPGSDGGGSRDRYRPATPEEAAMYGVESGQINEADGRFYPGAKPTNPGKPTASQDDAAFFAQISLNGLNKLNEMESSGYNRAGVGEQVAGSILGGTTGNGEQERLYDNAMLQFIDGYLRAMTGAAASPAEIENYKSQWAPQWGDSPAVVKQKAQGRAVAVEAMKRQAGPAWKPEMNTGPKTTQNMQPPSAASAAVGAAARNASAMGGQATAVATMQPGTIDIDDDTGDQYRFKGGDPTDQRNWELVR